MDTNKIANTDKYDFGQIHKNISSGTFKYLGKGSGRVVYDMGNGYAVKAARNQKGIAQNKAEYKIAKNDNSGLFAHILIVSEDFKYLVMDKADKVNSMAFVWTYFGVRNNKQFYRLKELHEACSRNGVLPWDLGRSANWGLINGKPVVIDYGFTWEVRRKYYKPRIGKLLRRR